MEKDTTDDKCFNVGEDVCTILKKEISDLSEQELFMKIPLEKRVSYYGTKKTEQLVLA